MIRLYPSGLEGEPLETHVIEAPVLLVDWLKQQAPDFSLDREHPICIKIGGALLPVEAWAEFVVRPDADVRIYPEPRASALVVAAWAAVAVAAVALVMVLSMKTPGYRSLARATPWTSTRRRPTEPRSTSRCGRSLAGTRYIRIMWSSLFPAS